MVRIPYNINRELKFHFQFSALVFHLCLFNLAGEF
jgi:hypothetical protein